MSLPTTRRLFSLESSISSIASLTLSGVILWDGGLIEAVRGSGESVDHPSITSGNKDVDPVRI